MHRFKSTPIQNGDFFAYYMCQHCSLLDLRIHQSFSSRSLLSLSGNPAYTCMYDCEKAQPQQRLRVSISSAIGTSNKIAMHVRIDKYPVKNIRDACAQNSNLRTKEVKPLAPTDILGTSSTGEAMEPWREGWFLYASLAHGGKKEIKLEHTHMSCSS